MFQIADFLQILMNAEYHTTYAETVHAKTFLADLLAIALMDLKVPC